MASQQAPTRRAGGLTEPARACAIICLLAAGLLGCYFSVLGHLRPALGNHALLWPVVALGCWAASSFAVPVRNRKASFSVSVIEIPVLVGVVFLTPALVLTACFVGQVAQMVQRRKNPGRGLASYLVQSLAVAAEVPIYHWVLTGHSPLAWYGWLAAAAGIVAAVVVDTFGMIVATRVLRGRSKLPPLVPLSTEVAIGAALSTVVGILAVTVTSLSPPAILLSSALAVPGGIVWRRAQIARRQHRDLQKLFSSVRALGSAPGGARELIETLLEQARNLMSAGTAAVAVALEPPLEHLALHARLEGDGPVKFSEAQAPGPATGEALTRRPAAIKAGAPENVDLLRELRATEAILVPFAAGDPSSGYLMVADRPFFHAGFDEGDVAVLSALAGNAAVVLRKSALIDKLAYEASLREHEARHDALTGLPNRASFFQQVSEALWVGDPGREVAVFIMDMDGFKLVNDTLGHQTGDTVLTEIAQRLVPYDHHEGAFVARLGGDEFGLMLQGQDLQASAHETASLLQATILEPLVSTPVELRLTASIGAAIGRAGQSTAQRLMSQADIAMYEAKEKSGGFWLYDTGSDRTTLRHLSMAGELRRAIDNGGLTLHYQPVHEVRTGALLSFEALARWSHEDLGFVPPDEFIPLAEHAGLIDPLTWWALDTALGQLRTWRQVAPELRVAVNISARTVSRPGLVERVAGSLSRADLAPSALRLELTESSMMAARGTDAIHALDEMGVSLSIDDFGTGFSSLSRLRHLPFSELKVDKSFVLQMEPGNNDEAIVRSVIEIARGLDKSVTAEGVETKAILDHLALLGCHAAQGYYISRPVPADKCGPLLSAYRPGAPGPGAGATGLRR
jgi:diguanylate cyclase (GGDEF)-like protein